MKNRFLCALVGGVLLFCVFPSQAVEFPGKAPGVARATQKNGVYTLSNAVMSLS